MTSQKTFLTELARIRKDKGWTQQQLAKMVGMRQPAIARIETGAVDPKLTTVVKLVVALGCKIDYIEKK